MAQTLGVSKKTVSRWCESGKLVAVPIRYGTKITYQIPPQALELLKGQALPQPNKAPEGRENSVKPRLPHAAYLPPWIQAMGKGMIGGRAFSPRTIEAYEYYAGRFFQTYEVLSLPNLEKALLSIPVESVSVKEKLYKALVCLAKFLIRQQALDADFLTQAKAFAPKYHKPPKRHSVSQSEVDALLLACQTLQERTIVQILVHTGLRASELCALTPSAINLETGVLTVVCGKGGKQRRVGLVQAAQEDLRHYLALSVVADNAPLFYNSLGQPLQRDHLYQLLGRIGKRAGVKVSPHALRRAFVTINANKGRPLQMLQRACGHSKITTTMSYCQTSEQEVIDAMRGWD